jgi:hypothetical protein
MNKRLFLVSLVLALAPELDVVTASGDLNMALKRLPL